MNTITVATPDPSEENQAIKDRPVTSVVPKKGPDNLKATKGPLT